MKGGVTLLVLDCCMELLETESCLTDENVAVVGGFGLTQERGL